MKLYDSVELAARNLREAVLRNSLTTLGIAVGVASLVAMLSLGVGLQRMATRHLRSSGLFDTVVVTSRRDLRAFNREQEINGPSAAESPDLNEAARQKIASIPGVVEAYPELRFVTELRLEEKAHLTMVSGMALSSKESDSFEGMQGRFFSSDEAHEVIIQKSFAAELLGRSLPRAPEELKVSEVSGPLLGKQLIMRYAARTASSNAQDSASYSVLQRELPLTIVGVTDLDPDSMRGSMRARVFLPEKLLESIRPMQAFDTRDATRATSSEPIYTSLIARVAGASKVASVEEGIKKLGFNTFSILDASKSMQRFFKILDMFLFIFGSLALTVASIGIVNTLVMAVLERRREIGIMKAIGASDHDVRGLFFAEAGAMGLLGGCLGVIFGWAIGKIIGIGTNVYLRNQGFPPEDFWAVTWWLVIFALGIAFIISLLSGLYPASRAAKLDPVQALRYE
ncbi:MAG TPA: ABC transporter permease [Terriglobales bacterium]|jgi:putative ABC transport system permease protein|nr:ABC transporter permease [Terriglobales bacterium]